MTNEKKCVLALSALIASGAALSIADLVNCRGSSQGSGCKELAILGGIGFVVAILGLPFLCLAIYALLRVPQVAVDRLQQRAALAGGSPRPTDYRTFSGASTADQQSLLAGAEADSSTASVAPV